jgi:hypothetical protein
VGAELLHVDRQREGRTDRHGEGKRRYRGYANATVKGINDLILDLLVYNVFQKMDVKFILLLDSD